ncbi:MAG: aminotransferase class V-fold PLP-dependent enzyme [Paracoccaceae bacterium]
MTPTSSLIHFNTAGSGLNSQAVSEAMFGYLHQELRYGSYETELTYADILERRIYRSVANLLGCKPDDVALFDSATRAWATAISSVRFKRDARVWITRYEYAGNILALQALIAQYDLRLEVIPCDSHGDIDLDWMAAKLDETVALVSVVHIPSNCGIVADVAAIGALLGKQDTPPLYFIDACQSVGQLPINVAHIKCDVLTGAGRKFLCGPRGTAFAFLSERFRACAPSQMSDLHVANVRATNEVVYTTDSAKRYELLERTNAAFIGLDIALRQRAVVHEPGQETVYKALCEMLADHPGLNLVKPGRANAGIVSFQHETEACLHIVSKLREMRINAWMITGSHTPIHMGEIGFGRAVRLSVSHETRLADVGSLDDALSEILPKPNLTHIGARLTAMELRDHLQ